MLLYEIFGINALCEVSSWSGLKHIKILYPKRADV